MSEIRITPKSKLLSVLISDVRALKFPRNCPKTERSIIGDLGQNPTILSPIVQNLNVLCPKSDSSVPFGPYECSNFRRTKMFEKGTFSFGFWTDAKNRTVWKWDRSEDSEYQTSSDLGLSLYALKILQHLWVGSCPQKILECRLTNTE